MAKKNISKLSLQMELDNQTQRVKFLEEKNSDLEQKLSKSEEFEQRLVNYLIISANQQDELEKELKELKILFLHVDIEKRKKQEEFQKALEDQCNLTKFMPILGKK